MTVKSDRAKRSLPAGLQANFPLRVQPGQSFAIANIWTALDAPAAPENLELKLTAWAMIHGRAL